ncbi:MAG: polysaccharide deacetylase family protein [Clostridia bacterium]|nr:polysaccharide deacetylase family protein [Clostridia bacterium]
MKNVIFTVDVEGHVGEDPVERLIYGNVNGEKCGIDLIMDLCDKHSVQGIFFVDIAEAFDYGKEKIANVIKHIIDRGHEVGVHIHPDHMADKKRLFLYEYTADEQYEILNKCTQFYYDAVGKRPLLFRAGKYGANRKTLELLKEFGYAADFSEFYGQKWCGIKPPVCGTDSVKLENGIIEIPVMSYRNSFPCIFNRYDKIDAAMPLSEYKYVMGKFKKDKQTNPIVLFAHSFSLIDWRANPDMPTKNTREIFKLDKMLEYIENCKELKFCKIADLLECDYSTESKIATPTVNGIPALCYMFPRAYKVFKMRNDIKKRARYNKGHNFET